MLLELLLALSKSEDRKVRPSLQWAGAVLLFVMALSLWAGPADSDPEFPAAAMWVLRIVLAFAFVAVVINLLRGGRKSRARVPTICPRCRRPLTRHDGGASCLYCGPGYAPSHY
jgi:peptidoglycan/LPS O-acetylase OafA/YrhL